MSMVCNNSYVTVYQHDYVTNGIAHGLFAVYASKAAKEAQLPPMYRDHIDFTYDEDSSDSIEVQAENAIKLLDLYTTCVTE